ncbi:iron-siderophore ABC transporter substrate-binding protein [Exiguobacterium sp.]|uniref:iron-siderophore ABC transporter substrate-binding protein n=1 Tax=Exiguobacterium sp. TaxID=44751 RepID=UPI00263B0799|nr:iron-siderophore ABC transporter substrate-binding protein [Exiguobacterium sp.]MCC5891004.1 iron-siderophore ABC transporter substrate-binding protein [Exiguobacterium sp.]
MKSYKKLLHMFIVLSAFVLVLAGCGTNNEDAATTDENEETAEGYPITIKHALGETVIDKKPERVATVGWSNQDVALALGVVPVGFSAANYGVQDGSGVLPWTAEKLKELGEDNPNVYQDTDGLDFEAIADSEPDVILAAYSGITQEDYDTLTQIAPVVAYQETPWVSSWQDTVLYDAMAMGMEAEGKQLIADTEKLIADKAAEVPDMQGKKAAFVALSPGDLSKFYIYTTGDPRGAFIEELGMEYPQNIKDQLEEGSFYLELSSENADILNDLDLFVVYGNEQTLKELQADPLYGKVPAIERGSVVLIEDNTPLAAAGTPSPLSIEYTIDEYVKLVSEALEKVE